MNHPSILERLAVCSWSLQPQNPSQLVHQIKRLGIRRVQIALDPIRAQPSVWGAFADLAADEGIQLVSGMMTTIGEDYATMESIRVTGGIVPDHTWEENLRNIRANAVLAKTLKLPLVTFHAGFMPEDESLPEYAKLRDRLNRVADVLADQGAGLGLETGQETAPMLRRFLEDLGHTHVGVNFDPANMILYDKGSPIESLRVLAPWLKQCHIKDATKTAVPGTWGAEVAVGTGQVDWAGFFSTLDEIGFNGFLAIEREAGNRRLADIAAARTHIEFLD